MIPPTRFGLLGLGWKYHDLRWICVLYIPFRFYGLELVHVSIHFFFFWFLSTYLGTALYMIHSISVHTTNLHSISIPIYNDLYK